MATTTQLLEVVHNPDHQAGLKSCYERALKTTGASGSVQRVTLKMPPRLQLAAPCIKGSITRWAFPANSQDYAAQFPLVLRMR
jgi:hypothetical protein